MMIYCCMVCCGSFVYSSRQEYSRDRRWTPTAKLLQRFPSSFDSDSPAPHAEPTESLHKRRAARAEYDHSMTYGRTGIAHARGFTGVVSALAMRTEKRGVYMAATASALMTAAATDMRGGVASRWACWRFGNWDLMLEHLTYTQRRGVGGAPLLALALGRASKEWWGKPRCQPTRPGSPPRPSGWATGEPADVRISVVATAVKPSAMIPGLPGCRATSDEDSGSRVFPQLAPG